MRLIFHGELKTLYGAEADMKADTVADAIEGFSRQMKDWPRRLRIAVAGFDTVEKLKSYASEVHIMPAMYGGGGKFTSIILGAAMVALGVVMVVTSFGTNALGWSLIVSGGLMMLQGAMSLFMKTPKSESGTDPAASKYLSVNKNTTAQNTPITLAWGRIDIAPHWLSLQSDSQNLSQGIFPATP